MVGGLMMLDKVKTVNKSGAAWHFKRGLSPEFVDALRELAEKPTWFRDVLLDNGLIIGIRNDYINVYVDGQSLFKVDWDPRKARIGISTHPKYLVDPALSKQVPFDGENFDISSINPMLTSYKVGGTLKQMKKSARLYSGVEKEGVHKVFRANPNVVDLEIALSKSADLDKATEDLDSQNDDVSEGRARAKRVDMACFEKIEGQIHLCFWEAKDYSNAELWASGDTLPPVVEQVSEYEGLIKKYENDIVTSYRTVAHNLVSLAEMAGRECEIGDLIKLVAAGEQFVIGTPAKVGVVVFGFSADEKAGARHRDMIKKLTRPGTSISARGKPANIRLRWQA
jgi:hypothetical protein